MKVRVKTIAGGLFWITAPPKIGVITNKMADGLAMIKSALKVDEVEVEHR